MPSIRKYCIKITTFFEIFYETLAKASYENANANANAHSSKL